MYGIVLGVTPPRTLRKMNSDNNVCSTLTKYDPDYIYVYARMNSCTIMLMSKSMRCYQTNTSQEIEQVKNVIPMTILGSPNRLV
jgi:hypothetical protein